MSTHTQPHHTPSPGDRYRCFIDPVTRTRFEGIACVISVTHMEPPRFRAIVRFVGEDVQRKLVRTLHLDDYTPNATSKPSTL